MPLAQQCKFFGHVIDIEKALLIRDNAKAEHRKTLPFECLKCGQPVRPRIAGDKWVAHFVHLAPNPECAVTEPPKPF